MSDVEEQVNQPLPSAQDLTHATTSNAAENEDDEICEEGDEEVGDEGEEGDRMMQVVVGEGEEEGQEWGTQQDPTNDTPQLTPREEGGVRSIDVQQLTSFSRVDSDAQTNHTSAADNDESLTSATFPFPVELDSSSVLPIRALWWENESTEENKKLAVSALVESIMGLLQYHPINLCRLIRNDGDDSMLDLWFTFDTENWLFGTEWRNRFMSTRGSVTDWRNLKISVLKSLVLYLVADTLNLPSGDSAPQTIPKDQTKTNNKQIFRRLVEICRSNHGFLPSSCSRGPPPGRTPLPCGQIAGLFPTDTRCRNATVWLKLCQEENGTPVVSGVQTVFLSFRSCGSSMRYFD